MLVYGRSSLNVRIFYLGVSDDIFQLDLVVDDFFVVLRGFVRHLLFRTKMINLGAGFSANVLGYGTQLFSDISSVVILAIGLPVGIWIVYKIANAWYYWGEDNRAADDAMRRAKADREATGKILDEIENKGRSAMD